MKVDARSIWAAGGFATVVALAANLVVYLVGRLAGVGFVATTGALAGQPITAVQVTIMSVLPTIVGIAFAVLLNRWGRLRTAQIVGAAFAVLSVGLIIPAGFDAASAIFLGVLHLLTGAVYVLGLQRAIRRGSATGTVERQPSEAVS
jgi:hypothetical protein